MLDAVSPRTDVSQVSVIIPTRNAEDALPAAVESVLAQDYPGPIEVIVADGSDTPATVEMLRRRYPAVRIVSNPTGTIPSGLNCALRVATGEIIVRCDSKTVLPSGYVRRIVAMLVKTGAANVGGRQHPIGTTFFERAVALATTTFLGVGNARYRLGGAEGPTDTVYLGAWYRKTLEDAEGFDPAFLVTEDYELNWRLRRKGGTVWFDPDLVASYRPRGNLRALARQYFDYGRGRSAVMRTHPLSLRARHLACPLLVLGLVASVALVPAGIPWAAAVMPLSYSLTMLIGAAATGVRHRDPAALLVPLVLTTMHLGWGIGFFFPPRTVPV